MKFLINLWWLTPLLYCDLSTLCIQSVVLKDSNCETAQFWTSYMVIFQVVLTLIRATRKTTLNCISAQSVCLVPNAHCTQSQQLRTIRTCLTDYTIKVWYTSQMQRTSQTNGFSVSQSLVLCLRNAFDITIWIKWIENPSPLVNLHSKQDRKTHKELF